MWVLHTPHLTEYISQTLYLTMLGETSLRSSTILVIARPQICVNSLAPLARHLLEFTLSRAEQEKFSQPYIHNTLQPKNKCNQSNLKMSTLMPRASLQALGFLRPSLVASQSRCSRSFHQYVTPILSIGPNTRVRQRFEFFKLKTKFQPHAFAGGVRTIFIQTENTPNPDVSKGPYTTSISC